MNSIKPENIDDYYKWCKKELNFEITSQLENYYNSITVKLKADFEKSLFWKSILDKRVVLNQEYLAQTSYNLFTFDFKPEIVTKSFSSFIEKTFRRNVIFNKNFPKAPYGGWITPQNWYENTNDIIRTFFVVKYLDGVEFLMQKISEIATENNLICQNSFEARDEGYYALHLYIISDFEIPKQTWDTEIKKMSIEIQVTTQLQDVISKLTHKFYEERRISLKKPDKKWQWNYKSDEFAVNYLGHILHYLEGMIMDVRQKTK